MQMKLGRSENEFGVEISVELVGVVWIGISFVITCSYSDLSRHAPILQEGSWYRLQVQLGGSNKSSNCIRRCSTISTQMEVIWWAIDLMITLVQVRVYLGMYFLFSLEYGLSCAIVFFKLTLCHNSVLSTYWTGDNPELQVKGLGMQVLNWSGLTGFELV